MTTKTLDSVMEDHFGDEPEVTEVQDTETPEPENEEVEEIEEEETPEKEEEKEDDYESPIKPVKQKEKESEPEEEEEPKTESEARKRAKIEGKERKRLAALLQERELELEKIREEAESLKTKANELESIRIKPEEHEDFVSLRERILQDARDTVDDFEAPNKNVVYEKLGTFITKYRAADKAQDRDAQLTALKDQLAAQMFGEESTWELLEKDDRKEVSAALKLIKSSTAKADELDSLRENLEQRAKSGTLAVGVREYEAAEKEFKPLLDAIGDLPDDVIESNPYTIESLVAQINRTDEGKKRVEKAKRDISEAIFGPKPLTQSDIDRIEKNGQTVKQFISDRDKRIRTTKTKLLPKLVQTLVAWGNVNESLSELAKFKTAKASRESEEDALLKTTRKPAPKKDEEPKKAKSVKEVLLKYGLDD